MARSVGDDWAEARALNNIGFLQALSTPIVARETLLQSVQLGRSIGDDWAVADGLKMVTAAWYVLHDEDGARLAVTALEAAGNELGARFFLAWAETMAGYFSRDRGEFDLAHAAFEAAEAHCRHVGDPSTAGFAQVWAAALQADRGQVATAREGLLGVLASAGVAGKSLAVPEALFALGSIEVREGYPERVTDLVGPQAEQLRASGLPSWSAQLFVVLAMAHGAMGELDLSKQALANAEATAEPLKSPLIDGLVHHIAACVALAEGDLSEAESRLHDGLAIQSVANLTPGMLRSLDTLAAIFVQRKRSAEAARILAVIDRIRHQLPLPRGRREVEKHLALRNEIRDTLGTDEFDTVVQATATTELDEIVEYVSRMRGKSLRPRTGWPSLTPTERRVVALVTEGLTNPQIAKRMFVARGTVKVHLSHIFDKLGVSSRTRLTTKSLADGFE